ncbi:MAG: protein kinase domain-containing protein [Kofleriaceae bacterium]
MTCPSCGYHLDEADAAFCGDCGASVRVRRRTLVGATLDERYRIDGKIAEGGFGTIYRATHVASGLDVALKVLHADLANDRSLVTRFRREAACLERLHDPHTVACYEVGQSQDGTLYIAMELLVGQSLHDRMLAQGRLGWRTALSIVRDACSSLAEAHELGIVHRDLKPANLHLGANDYVKVLDFGIARITNSEVDDGNDLTRMGQMIGTLEYMAPEQVVGGVCDPRSDIYQLGILSYEMITGRRPFASSTNPTSLITALLTQQVPAPSMMFCGGCLPQEVDRLILRCLEREPEHRFASVHRLVDAIDAALLLSDTQHSQRNLDADDEAPTWIASSHSKASAMAPARTTIGPRVEPAVMPAFEVPVRGTNLDAQPFTAPIGTPTPDRGFPIAKMPDVITPNHGFTFSADAGQDDLTKGRELTSSERRLAMSTSSPAVDSHGASHAARASSPSVYRAPIAIDTAPAHTVLVSRGSSPFIENAPKHTSIDILPNYQPSVERASSPSVAPVKRGSSPVLPPSVVPIHPSAMLLRSPDVSLPGLPPERAPSPSYASIAGYAQETPPDVLVAAGSSTTVPVGPQTDPVIKLLYPQGKREVPLDLDNTPERKSLSFGARIALWVVGLSVGGIAVGAAIANLVS